MNNPNPLLPPGSSLEQRAHPRSRVKMAVFFVLSIHVVALVGLLLVQGCKRDTGDAGPPPEHQTLVIPPFEPAVPPPDFPGFEPHSADTAAPVPLYEPPPFVAQPAAPPVQPEPAVPPAAGQTYKIQSGDTFYSLAKKFSVSMQAIANANPGVDPTRLQIGQSINIPAPAPAQTSAPAATTPAGQRVHVVQSGDTLTRIADRYGTTVKAIRTANNLPTTTIRVGQQLVIPAPTQGTAPAAPTPPGF